MIPPPVTDDDGAGHGLLKIPDVVYIEDKVWSSIQVKTWLSDCLKDIHYNYLKCQKVFLDIIEISSW